MSISMQNAKWKAGDELTKTLTHPGNVTIYYGYFCDCSQSLNGSLSVDCLNPLIYSFLLL